MTATLCPIECVTAACEEPDFLTKHNAFVLTLVGIFSGALGVITAYFLKSRCTKIGCFCINCERTPLNDNANANDNDNVNANAISVNVENL